MPRRRKQIRDADYYKKRYLERRGVDSFSECLLQGSYFGKYDENGELRYIGSSSPIPRGTIPVILSISERQHVPLSDNGDFWGFLRYRNGRIVSAYRGYFNSREKWTNATRLEEDGIGCFLRLNVSEK